MLCNLISDAMSAQCRSICIILMCYQESWREVDSNNSVRSWHKDVVCLAPWWHAHQLSLEKPRVWRERSQRFIYIYIYIIYVYYQSVVILYYCCFDFCRSGAQQVCHHLVCVFVPLLGLFSRYCWAVRVFACAVMAKAVRVCLCCSWKQMREKTKQKKQHTHMHTHLCTIGKKRITQENKFTRLAHVHTLSFTQTSAHYTQTLRRKICSPSITHTELW